MEILQQLDLLSYVQEEECPTPDTLSISTEKTESSVVKTGLESLVDGLPTTETKSTGGQAIATELPATSNKPINHALNWWQGQAAYYLRLMNQTMSNQTTRYRGREGVIPAHVKRHEISRLHRLRQEALAKVRELGGI